MEAVWPIDAARAKAKAAGVPVYGDKPVAKARQVGVHVFGNGSDAVVLGDCDSSMQRQLTLGNLRLNTHDERQYVVVEGPAPNLSSELRNALHNAAISICKAVQYRSAGTVSFIVDAASNQFFFL